ncbi:MAG: HAD-IIIC family phosphatase [Flavobacteriales bacterium]|nr:HAD-IIIC family phosphatase [Flavobacteriales bacterium]
MSLEAPRILLLSDVNMANAAAWLKKKVKSCVVQEVPFNQIHVLLIDEEHAIWKNRYDILIWWCRKEAVASFTTEELKKHVERISNKADVSIWIGFGGGTDNPVDQFHLSLRKRVYELNDMLAEHCMEQPTQRLYVPEEYLIGNNWEEKISADLWYHTKTLWHKSVYERLAELTQNFIKELTGGAVKLIVCDLDDTLWGGIVGDDGWQNLHLGGHDALGEAFADIQMQLLEWKRRGVMLAIVSKNEEETALEAIRRHPEMRLKEDDFVGWKINWNDKAENIETLARELNIGLQHIMFLDDNPAERIRVKQALPEVMVPELPSNKLAVPFYLKTCLYVPIINRISKEDKERAVLYHQEQARRQAAVLHSSKEDWIRSLEMKVMIVPLNEENLMRASQLLNKTNQMNLRTRRMSEQELWRWAKAEGNLLYTVSVEDRFGSAGLTGLLGLRIEKNGLILEDFVLSCRVMGRQVEACMITFALKLAAHLNLKYVIAEFIPTAKNNPCKELFSSLCNNNQDFVFSWEVTNLKNYPPGITVVEEMN